MYPNNSEKGLASYVLQLSLWSSTETLEDSFGPRFGVVSFHTPVFEPPTSPPMHSPHPYVMFRVTSDSLQSVGHSTLLTAKQKLICEASLSCMNHVQHSSSLAHLKVPHCEEAGSSRGRSCDTTELKV